MFNIIRRNIPNTITLLNCLSGVLAIAFAFRFNETIAGIAGWKWSIVMIAAAAVFDFLDGAAARLLGAYSPLGKELDSLSDTVSFGVAPAMLLYNYLLVANNNLLDANSSGIGLFVYAPFFLPLMAGLRLAKFNIDTTQATEFRGLPVPANAMFWVGMVWALVADQLTIRLNVLVILIVALGLLMVCRLRMFSLKFHNFAFRENLLRYTIILATIALVAWLGVAGLAAAIGLYVLLSALNSVISFE
ncbi:MAG: CDP-diacylglycerol--serine O-phosphatidyltransferase [Muribaculaceae bacterium]|nr:CDP-diacylglycerol--serine O-phosphatidyltransferase [Muribaculaceae bacterium]MDE7393041.1 CDP-diacylglycerol--serine O-phosphatidyltransferase [Muribaculaceae bacterium]